MNIRLIDYWILDCIAWDCYPLGELLAQSWDRFGQTSQLDRISFAEKFDEVVDTLVSLQLIAVDRGGRCSARPKRFDSESVAIRFEVLTMTALGGEVWSSWAEPLFENCWTLELSSEEDMVAVTARQLDIAFDVLDLELMERGLLVVGSGPMVWSRPVLRLPEWCGPSHGYSLSASVKHGNDPATYVPKTAVTLPPIQKIGFGNLVAKELLDNPFAND